MRIKVILLLIFCSSFNVYGGELHGIINGKAYHFDRSQDWNENNYGLGFEYDFDQHGDWIPLITGSSFKDSFNQTSIYLGGGVKRRFLLSKDPTGFHFDIGAVGFLMTRKDHNDNKPFPGLLPFVSVGNEYVAINMTFVPKVSPKFANLLYFQFMFKIVEF